MFLKRIVFILALASAATPAYAEQSESPFRWSLRQDETLKYETIINSSSKMPVPQEEAPGGRSKEQLEKELKEYFGDNYEKGYLSNQATQITMTLLKKISDNQINLKTLIVDEKTTALQDFIKSGVALKKGLVISNFHMNNEGKLIPSKDNQKQPPTQIDSNPKNLLQNLLFDLPEKIKKPGDSEKLEIPCMSYDGFPIVKHKKTGTLKFQKIEKNKNNQEIAVLSYNYYERIDIRDTQQEDYSKIETSICQYKGFGRFNLTAGRWELLNGKLKTAMRRDQAIEMSKQDFMTIHSSMTIQIKPTDKNPPKEISQEDYFKALQAANPELFEDSAETPNHEGQKPP